MKVIISLFLILINLLLVDKGGIKSAFAEKDKNSLMDVNTTGLEKNESQYKWGNDPFLVPKNMRHKGQEGALRINGMVLNGIIYKSGGGVAIINNKIIKKGDIVSGKKLVEILKDRVILSDGDEKIELMVERFSSNP